MNDKNLILVEKSVFYPEVDGIDIESIYKPIPKILRLIRFFHHRLGILPALKKIWLGKWKYNLVDYDKVMVFDSIFDYTPIEYIRKHRSDIEINFCYRNRVHQCISRGLIERNPEEIRRLFGCRVWSYNEDDCAKYELIYYNQFHLLPENIISDNSNVCQDVYFVGIDKGRLEDLKQLDKTLTEAGISTKIEIVPTPGKKYAPEDKKYLIKSRPYSDVINAVSKSRCVIDWVTGLNHGMTFRGLEAMVLKKKLITNFSGIRHVDFYNPENIFIVGEDSIERLPDFIKSDFDNSISSDTEKYSFRAFCHTVFC